MSEATQVIASDQAIQESGVTQAPDISFDAPPLEPIEPRHTLADISKERVLFSHAPLIVHAGMNPDPLQAFQAEHKLQTPIAMLRTPVKAFKGLALRNEANVVVDDSWEYTLFAIDKRDFPALYRFLGSLAAIERPSKTVITTLCQVLQMVDVVAICNKSVLPRVTPLVPVATFGLNTNHGQVYFLEPKIKSLLNPITVGVNQRPDPKVVEMGRALLAEQPQPLAADDPVEGKIEVVGDPTELVTTQEPANV